MHDIGVAFARDQVLGGLRLASGVDRGPGFSRGLGLEDRLLDVVEAPGVREARLPPQSLDDSQPFFGPFVAAIVLVEGKAMLRGLVFHQEDTTFKARRPPLIRSMLAACLAKSAG